MPTPEDLCLPPKFPRWRRIDRFRTQEDVVIAAACSDKRFVIINAPTGIGKSPIYMAVASLIGGRGLVLTQTKDLQAQLSTDFSQMGLVEIKGQANYPCLYFDGEGRKRLPGCDEGPCHAGIECVLRDSSCYYYSAVRKAARSQLVSGNYAYWMSIQRYSEPLTIGKFNTLILDEAHDAAKVLSEFVQVTLERRETEKLLEMSLPYGATVDEWVEWAVNEALPRCRLHLDSAKASVSLYHSGITVLRRLQKLENAILDLARAGNWRRVDAPDPPAWIPGTTTDWIVEESKDGVTFQPVWASGYAEQYLFANIPRVFLVSATVTPKDAEYLGIGKDDFDYFQYPSPFKREIRPVVVIPGAKVSRNMMKGEEKIWIRRIDEIIEEEAVRKSQKGIIHAVSYERAKLIYAMSKWKGLIEIHDRRATREAVTRYRRSDPPCILLSPSVSTGWDFPMDEARFQIIAKVPFIDSRPEVIKARARIDKRYLDYVALVTLIQMAGRGVRSEQDYCITYIIDDNFKTWFYPRNKDLFPKWFKSAIIRANSMDQVDMLLRSVNSRRFRRIA